MRPVHVCLFHYFCDSCPHPVDFCGKVNFNCSSPISHIEHAVFCLFKGMVKRVVNAKIACLDFSLQKTKTKMGVQVIINDPEKLDQIRQRLMMEHFSFFCPIYICCDADSIVFTVIRGGENISSHK